MYIWLFNGWKKSMKIWFKKNLLKFIRFCQKFVDSIWKQSDLSILEKHHEIFQINFVEQSKNKKFELI